MIAIKTNRLKIRNFSINDFRDLQEIIISKETSEYAIYDHEFPTSVDEVKIITERFTKSDRFLAVCELTDNKVIGYVCLNGDNEKELDIGYCFNSAFKGKGYATEACISVINYAFNNLSIERLSSGTANLNYPSNKLLIKLGFVKISESTYSFRKTTEGNPIEFVGSTYLLEKDEWMKKEYS